MVLRTALIASFVVGCGFETPSPDPTLPEVSFVAAQSLTDETISSTPILLKLSMQSGEAVTVGYSVAGGTAKADADFTAPSGVVTFEPFQDTAQLVLTIKDDGMEEEEEDILIKLESADKAQLGELIEHRLRISQNKLPRARFVAAASSAGEDKGPQEFAVELDTLSPEDVVVRYTWSGSAEPADHGVTTEGYLTIRAGTISQAIPAPITNDPTDEDDETVDLALIAQTGAVIAPGLGQHVHTIVDDDLPPTVGFSDPASAVVEAGGTAMIPVSLSLASEKQITVSYAAAAGGSAVAEDFTLAAGTLTFPPGTTTLSVPVTITNDLLDEPDETVQIALANPTNATLARTAHALTITDDDDAPTLQFQQATSTASEATATHAVTVQLSAPSGRTVQFSLSRAGSATSADLTLPQTPISIPAGTTSVSFNTTVLNDTDDDDGETVVLTLTNLVNASAGPQATHTITITDDDGPPSVRFDPNTADRSENERDVTSATYIYRVVLSVPSTQQVTVQVAVAGTAMNNDFDIPGTDIPVVFQPGETSKEIRLTIDADTQPEENETVTLTLGTATNATNADNNQVRTHTIVNDD